MLPVSVGIRAGSFLFILEEKRLERHSYSVVGTCDRGKNVYLIRSAIGPCFDKKAKVKKFSTKFSKIQAILIERPSLLTLVTLRKPTQILTHTYKQNEKRNSKISQLLIIRYSCSGGFQYTSSNLGT